MSFIIKLKIVVLFFKNIGNFEVVVATLCPQETLPPNV